MGIEASGKTRQFEEGIETTTIIIAQIVLALVERPDSSKRVLKPAYEASEHSTASSGKTRQFEEGIETHAAFTDEPGAGRVERPDSSKRVLKLMMGCFT